MREYNLGFDETLALPVRRFWFLSNQVDRLRADEARQQIDVLLGAQSKDALEWFQKENERVLGQVTVRESPRIVFVADQETGMDPTFDKEGLLALKMMASAG